MKILHKKIIGSNHYSKYNFCDESDIEYLQKNINQEFTVKQINAIDIDKSEVVFLKDLKNYYLTVTDSEEIYYNENDEIDEIDISKIIVDLCYLYLDSNKIEIGEITGIPANKKILTIVLKSKDKKEINYLSDDELNFLIN